MIGMSGSVLDVVDEAQLAGDVPTVVHFWAAWCRPCAAVDAVLGELCGRHPGLRFARAEAEALPRLAQRYAVRVVHPTDPAKSVVHGGPNKKWNPTGAMSQGYNIIRRERLLDPASGFMVEGRVIFEADITKVSGQSTARRLDEIKEVPASLVRDVTAMWEASATVPLVNSC